MKDIDGNFVQCGRLDSLNRLIAVQMEFFHRGLDIKMLWQDCQVVLPLKLTKAQCSMFGRIVMLVHAASSDQLSHTKEPFFFQSFGNIQAVDSVDCLSLNKLL